MLEKRMAFEKEEFMERLNKVQQEIRDKKLDLLLVNTPENIFYLSGYHSAGYYMYNCLIVFPNREPLLVLRFGEVGNAQIFSWLDDDQIILYDDTENPLSKTVQTIKKYADKTSSIGIETTSFFFSVRNYLNLNSQFASSELVDAAGLVDQFRMIKSPTELRYIREAAKAVNAGMRAGMSAVKEGENEDLIASAIWGATVANGCQHVGMEPFVAKGWKSGLMHDVWSRETVKKGDSILFEIPASINRYHAALMRTCYVGPAPEIIKEWSDVCIESLNAALKAIRPGALSGEVDEACRGVIERAGLYNNFRKRTGYSIGIAFAPDWGEGHICSLQKDDERVLEAGMVFHMPPAIREQGKYGVGFSETVIVTEDGGDIITDFPRKLIEI